MNVYWIASLSLFVIGAELFASGGHVQPPVLEAFAIPAVTRPSRAPGFITPATVDSSYNRAITADSPVAYLRFADATGTNAADSSVQQVPARYVGRKTLGQLGLFPGESDTSVLFDGETSYAYQRAASIGPTWSIETWLKTTTSEGGYIASTNFGSPGTAGRYSVASLSMTSSGKLLFAWYYLKWNCIVTSWSYNDGYPHYIALSYGPSLVTLYVDGIQAVSQLSPGPIAIDNAYITFGSGNSNGGAAPATPYLAAHLEKAALYVETLSSTRVHAHFAASGVPPERISAPVTVDTDAFLNSIGINAHLDLDKLVSGTDETNYGAQFPLVSQLMFSLGVKHVRLAMPAWVARSGTFPYCQKLASWARRGITFDFLTLGLAFTGETTILPPPCSKDLVEAYEGLNEVDDYSYGDVGQLRTSQEKLWNDVQASDPGKPVYGFSVDGNLPAVHDTYGSLSAYMTYGNVHPYPYTLNPENGKTLRYLEYNRSISANKPVVATESGYTDGPSDSEHVTTYQAAMYIPRLLLFNYVSGIHRTYLYELANDGSRGDANYGLLDFNANPKPQYYALRSMIYLLRDNRRGLHNVGLHQLTYSLTGWHAAFTKTLLLEKSDGSYWLAVWNDNATSAATAHNFGSDQKLTLTLPVASSVIAFAYNTRSGLWQYERTPLGTGKSFSLVSSDEVRFYEVGATTRPAAPQPAPTNPNAAYEPDLPTQPSITPEPWPTPPWSYP